MAVEFKSSKSPKVSRGFYNALDDLSIEEGWVVIPSEGSYASRRCQIAGLADFIRLSRAPPAKAEGSDARHQESEVISP